MKIDNEDWLRTRTWDMYRGSTPISTIPDLLWALDVDSAPYGEQLVALRHFVNLPAFQAAPASLKHDVAVFFVTEAKKAVVQKGDLPGHEFHGNQYESGFGEGSKYLGVKTTETVKDLGETKYGGSGNYGISKVRLADGTTGIVKHGVGATSANCEVLGGRIASALGVSVRGAVDIGESPKNIGYGHSLLQPFIKGRTLGDFIGGAFSDPDEVTSLLTHESHYANALKLSDSALHDLAGVHFFDELTGNTDRHASNVLVTNKGEGVVGIDQGLCFSLAPQGLHDLRTAADLAGFSADDISRMNVGMQGLMKDVTLNSWQQDTMLNDVMPAWNNFVTDYQPLK